MARRPWTWLVTVGWLAGLTPGCQHTVAMMPDDRPAPAVAAASAGPRTREAVAAAAPSPAPLPAPPPKDASPPPTHIEQTHYPVSQPGQSTPLPLPEPPGPFREVPRKEVPPPPVQPEKPPVEDPPLVAALRCYLNKQPAEALALLERYDRSNQELLLVLLPLAARLTETSVRQLGAREATTVLAQLDSLQRPLQERANLTLDKMCFCRRIERFGVYESLPEDHAFRPQELVQLYVELRNFSSQLKGDQYVIPLAARLEIQHWGGKVVSGTDIAQERCTETSHTPRRDHFINYQFFIPDDLPPGPYTLRVKVTDVLTHRTAEKTLDFRVTSAPPHGS